MKRTIVYLNPDFFTDTDLTVLKYLAKKYRVVWYYIYESIKSTNRISIEKAIQYSEQYGIELHSVDSKVRYRSPKNLEFYIRIAKEINQINPDLVYHCNSSPYWSLAVKFVLKCKKVVLGVHDAQTHSYKLDVGYILGKYTKGLSIKVHKYFITFSQNQQVLFKKVYGKDSCMVGMSYKYFGQPTIAQPAFSDGVKLLFFGRIDAYKGLDLLISALENLRIKNIRNLSLTIAGKGISWSDCEKLLKTTEMYNLQVRFIDNNEIPNLMASHQFLVLPYRDATQSGPLATAEAYELPVIAPDFGCFTETYTKDSAILYPQGHLEDALMEVSKMSGDTYASMKAACRKVKENNGEEKIAINYIRYFDKLMDCN